MDYLDGARVAQHAVDALRKVAANPRRLPEIEAAFRQRADGHYDDLALSAELGREEAVWRGGEEARVRYEQAQRLGGKN